MVLYGWGGGVASRILFDSLFSCFLILSFLVIGQSCMFLSVVYCALVFVFSLLVHTYASVFAAAAGAFCNVRAEDRIALGYEIRHW